MARITSMPKCTFGSILFCHKFPNIRVYYCFGSTNVYVELVALTMMNNCD